MPVWRCRDRALAATKNATTQEKSENGGLENRLRVDRRRYDTSGFLVR